MNKKILYTLIIVVIIGAVFLFFRTKAQSNVSLTSAECFDIDKEKGEITAYKTICGTEVNIPSEISGTKVTSIKSFVFSGKGLTKLILPETLVTIGSGAFENNEITSITIPDSVTTIKAYAFHKNKLTSIKIGKGVTNIGVEAFNDNLVSGNDAFIYLRTEAGTSSDTIIGYAGKERDKVVIPSGTDDLYISSFAECGIKSVTLNKELTRIEAKAFEANDISELTIPKSVIIVGQGILTDNTNLTKITIEGKSALSEFSSFDSEIDTNIITFNK